MLIINDKKWIRKKADVYIVIQPSYEFHMLYRLYIHMKAVNLNKYNEFIFHYSFRWRHLWKMLHCCCWVYSNVGYLRTSKVYLLFSSKIVLIIYLEPRNGGRTTCAKSSVWKFKVFKNKLSYFFVIHTLPGEL